MGVSSCEYIRMRIHPIWLMEKNKLTCGVCKFSAFLADEEAWWCPELNTYVDPDLREPGCPRDDLEELEKYEERDT